MKGDAAGKKSKKGGEGYKVCPAGHPLFLFLTPHDEYVCDACDTGDFLEQGTTMLGCRYPAPVRMEQDLSGARFMCSQLSLLPL